VEDCIELLGRERGLVAARIAAGAAAAKIRGRRPLVVLPSLGHPRAVAGVAQGYVEAMRQIRERGEPAPRTLFITAASGTTLAGLLLGERLERAAGAPPVRIVGASVYEGPIRSYVRLLLRLTRRALKLKTPVGDIEFALDERALHGGYARWPRELAAVCERVLDQRGLSIDPIYGGKTWSVLESVLRAPGELSPPWIYWHCGFTPNWQRLGPS
jgi:1-aminocyclopropane-1-carboxylate deaminase/D-cysteine desulfhydrase-like pyridoxal-dependent ACC family enzyme